MAKKAKNKPAKTSSERAETASAMPAQSTSSAAGLISPAPKASSSLLSAAFAKSVKVVKKSSESDELEKKRREEHKKAKAEEDAARKKREREEAETKVEPEVESKEAKKKRKKAKRKERKALEKEKKKRELDAEDRILGNTDGESEEFDTQETQSSHNTSVDKQSADSEEKNLTETEGAVTNLKPQQPKGGDEEIEKAIDAESKQKEDVDARTIFVGNVPINVSKKVLQRFFSVFGAVESSRLRSVSVMGTAVDKAGDQKLVKKVCVNRGKFNPERDSCNAYVVFKQKEAAVAALAANGKELEGKIIRVDSVNPTIDSKRSVFLGNLPFDTTEEQVRSLFAAQLTDGANAIASVRIVRDAQSGLGKGFGYVLFQDASSVAEALAMKGSKIKNREIRIQVCGKRYKGTKGKWLESAESSKPVAGAKRRLDEKKKDEVVKAKKAKGVSGGGKKVKPGNKVPAVGGKKSVKKSVKKAYQGRVAKVGATIKLRKNPRKKPNKKSGRKKGSMVAKK